MYLKAEDKEKDDKIIGEKTPRFYIGNYISPNRLGEELKVFSQFGEFDGQQNVTAYGIFSTKYGILVKPSTKLIFNQGSIEDHTYITDAGYLSVGSLGEKHLKPEYEGRLFYGPDAYYYPEQKIIGNIKYSEALEALKYAIEKANGETIEPITPEELYDVVSKARGLEEESSKEMFEEHDYSENNIAKMHR